LEYIANPEFTELDNQPRMILGAEEFPAEITASVMWLRTCNIDIRCVRLRPYQVGEHLLVDASVLIPLPEPEDFVIRRERKEAEVAQQARVASNSVETQALHAQVIEGLQGQPGFPSKTPPKSSPGLWYKLMGKNSYLGVIRGSDGTRVELYIDEGERAFNRRVRATLHKARESIEQEIGHPVIWDSDGEAKSRKCAVISLRPRSAGEQVEEMAAWAVNDSFASVWRSDLGTTRRFGLRRERALYSSGSHAREHKNFDETAIALCSRR
jgi:hypothetical protein